MLSYNRVKNRPKTFRAMTSLDVEEFSELCKVFEAAWHEHREKGTTDAGQQEKSKGGRKPILKKMEDRLFFILFYLKTYPLQQVIAFLFDMSQGQANYLIHDLSEVLKFALDKKECLPQRVSEKLVDLLKEEAKQDEIIDGTERRIQRPSDDETQKRFFSGKSHAHTVKNVIVVGANDRQIKYLSKTSEGSKHDKKIVDEEELEYPEKTDLYQDAGFQGYQPDNVHGHQPTKKPRGGELTAEEKETNSFISSIRVVVEHVIAGIKRCRIVKDMYRNTKEDYDDLAIELACGLHNLRTEHRRLIY